MLPHRGHGVNKFSYWRISSQQGVIVSGQVCRKDIPLSFSCLSQSLTMHLIGQIHQKVRRQGIPAAAKSFQSCPTLCDPIDGSPPGSPVPGILQARTLEWVAISQSCPTLCDPIDSSPPGSPIRGILQVRTLEWVAISFSNA